MADRTIRAGSAAPPRAGPSPRVCLTLRPVRYALLAANAAGLTKHIPHQPANPPTASSAASSEPVAHWMAVRRKGDLLAARTIRCQGDYRSSAAITILFADTLTEAAVASRPGVHFLTLNDLSSGLAFAGITISEEKMA